MFTFQYSFGSQGWQRCLPQEERVCSWYSKPLACRGPDCRAERDSGGGCHPLGWGLPWDLVRVLVSCFGGSFWGPHGGGGRCPHPVTQRAVFPSSLALGLPAWMWALCEPTAGPTRQQQSPECVCGSPVPKRSYSERQSRLVHFFTHHQLKHQLWSCGALWSSFYIPESWVYRSQLASTRLMSSSLLQRCSKDR